MGSVQKTSNPPTDIVGDPCCRAACLSHSIGQLLIKIVGLTLRGENKMYQVPTAVRDFISSSLVSCTCSTCKSPGSCRRPVHSTFSGWPGAQPGQRKSSGRGRPHSSHQTRTEL